MNRSESPESQTVGKYYDHPIFDLMTDLGDGNLHYGYWIDENDQSTFEEAMEEMTSQMIRRLRPTPGQRILDVGCGNGTPGTRLGRDHQVEVVGVTVSERQVARANERARDAGLADRVRFELATAMDLPFPAESFDGAWALESMLHMPDKAKVLSEIARVLRPGGRISIADMTYREPTDADAKQRIPIGNTTIYASLTKFSEYAKLIEDAGLIPLEVTDITEETSRSNPCYVEWMQERRDRYVQILGDQGYELLIGNQRNIALMPELGYIMITAQRP